MALELNKMKYLVMCVMLIMLNHYINGIKAAEPKDAEPKTPESGSKVETPENGSKDPASQVSNSGSKTHESQDSKKDPITTKDGSKESGPKTPDSQDSRKDYVTTKDGFKESGSKTPESQDSKNDPTTTPESKESGSKTPESQVSTNGSKGSGSSAENGSKNPNSQVLKNDSKTAESGSKAETPESGKSDSKAEGPENGSKSPVPQDSDNGSKPSDSSVPKIGTKGAEPHIIGNGKNSVADVGPQALNGIKTDGTTGTQVPNNGNKIVAPLIPITGNKTGPPQVPCYFIFGDSLVDAGNNNILKTLARADYSPYGIDFKPAGPTGRFSNGKTVVDVMTELLGFDHYMPPSEQAFGATILQGLNFASAAAGIREETAQHLGDRITMKEQVDNFRRKVDEMALLLGGPKNTTDYLGKCLFQVGLGSNDYLNNYFIPNIYPTSKLLTPEQYADELIKQYTTHLMGIYNLGARKIALTGVSQIGCCPNALAQGSPDGTCVKHINDANEMFNTRLRTLVDNLNKEHPDAKFTYVNSFGLFQELKDKAATYGFKVTTDGCCGLGKNNGFITCLPGQTPCPNRNEYLFWDAYHPTEATNIIGAKRSYIKEIPTDAHPYDIHTLITL